MSYNQNSGVLSSTTLGSGTDNAIVRWDGTSGKIIQDSSIKISDADAQGSVGFSISSTTYQFVRDGVASGDVGFIATQKLASLTAKAGADISGLTGTTTVNASTTVTGSGTLFLEELSELDKISVSSASSTYRTIRSISSNTSLVVSGTLGSSSATKTINRKRAIQTWRDSSNSFVGGFAVDGSFLIGSPDYSALYFSDNLYGALTVNRKTQTTIASFYNNGTFLAHINNEGHIKTQTGVTGAQYASGNVFGNTLDEIGSGYSGVLTNIFTQAIAAYTLSNGGDAVRVKVFGDGDDGAATFRVYLAGTNIFDYTIAISTVKHWELNILILWHVGSGMVKTIVTLTTSPTAGVMDGNTQYATFVYDNTTSYDLTVDVNDYGVTGIRHQGSVTEWLPSYET